MESKDFVFPGDVLIEEVKKKTQLGAGVHANGGSIEAVCCGKLSLKSSQQKQQVAVGCVLKRYIAKEEDVVLGTVLEKHGEGYRLDIGHWQLAQLSALAFEGATKRNKPKIEVGATICCRVETALKDMEPEVSCVCPSMKKEWVTGQTLLGELIGGYQFNCFLSLCHSLLQPDCYVLNYLGNYFPFEVAVGINGRVWVRANSNLHTILIVNAILNSQHLSDPQTKAMVQALVKSIN